MRMGLNYRQILNDSVYVKINIFRFNYYNTIDISFLQFPPSSAREGGNIVMFITLVPKA